MNEEVVHQTIRGLYEGVLDESAWQASLIRLCEASGSEHASLVEFDAINQRLRIREMHAQNQQLVEAYNNRYHAEDPSRAYMPQLGLGDWYIDSRDLGQANMSRLTFYRNFMCEFGLGSIMGCLVESKPHRNTYFLLQRPLAREPFQADDARRLGWAVPHLRQALDLRERTHEVTMLAQLSAQVLDRLPFGVIVFTSNGRVLLSNARGEPWVGRLLPGKLGSPGGAAGDEGWRLSRPFRDMLAAACSPVGAIPVSATQARDNGGNSASVIALPLPQSHPLAVPMGPAALVAIREAGSASPALPVVLQELYGLTAAEIRLAICLRKGIGLPEASSRLSIARETVRTQVKTIFKKTGTGTQAGLAHLLTELEVAAGLG